jgi:hypothetical protein
MKKTIIDYITRQGDIFIANKSQTSLPNHSQAIDGITNQLTCEGMTTYQTALDKLR